MPLSPPRKALQTPYARYSTLYDADVREYPDDCGGLAWARPASAVSADVNGREHAKETVDPEHAIEFQVTARW